MPIFIVLILIQIFCAHHVVTTGRDKYWIFLILMAPGIGCAIYFFTQVLPDMGQGHAARQIKHSAAKVLDPNREFRQAMQAFDMVESTENRLRLADALIDLGKWQEAEPHLKLCLSGALLYDPHTLMRLARVKLELGQPDAALALLDQLQEKNPGFQSQDGHLLYCRALSDANRTDEALEAYDNLVSYATGEEARVRFGLLLQHAGHLEKAAGVFNEVSARLRRGTSYYRKTQAKWAEAVRRARSNL